MAGRSWAPPLAFRSACQRGELAPRRNADAFSSRLLQFSWPARSRSSSSLHHPGRASGVVLLLARAPLPRASLAYPQHLTLRFFWARVAWRCWTSANLRNQKCPSRRQLRESGAREVSKSAQLMTLLYATAALALMVRSPWLAASYDLPQRSCWPKGEFVLLRNVAKCSTAVSRPIRPRGCGTSPVRNCSRRFPGRLMRNDSV